MQRSFGTEVMKHLLYLLFEETLKEFYVEYCKVYIKEVLWGVIHYSTEPSFTAVWDNAYPEASAHRLMEHAQWWNRLTINLH